MSTNPSGYKLIVEPGDTAIVFSDVHFKSHNKRAMDILVAFAQDIRPTYVIGNGDIFDCHALCRLGKEAKLQVESGALIHEAQAGKPYMDALRDSATKQAFVGPGNHEDRWTRFVNENPGLYGLDWHTPYDSALTGWKLLEDDYEIYAGGLTICHGHTLAGSTSKYCTAKVAANHPRENILFGHSHRVERHSETLWSGGEPHEHTVWTYGHLQDVSKVKYAKRTLWRMGFALVRWWDAPKDKKIHFSVDQMELFMSGNGVVMEGAGKVYRA